MASPAVAATDRGITSWVVAHRSPALDRAMAALTWTGFRRLVLRAGFARWVVATLAVAVTALVAFSRVELGAHRATDVTASLLWTPC